MAAKETGKSVPTITRAIKSGKLSAEKTESGGYSIDPSELFRVFPPLTDPNLKTPTKLDSAIPKDPPIETLLLQEKISNLEAALEDAKAERDEWRAQAKRLALSLPAPDTVKSKQGFWKRLFS